MPSNASATSAGPCRLCTFEATALAYSIAGTQVDRCQRCGFFQVRSPPTSSEIAAIYSEKYFDHQKYEGNWSSKRETNRRLALLSKAGVRDGSRVLDAGCATGDFILSATSKYEMWGLDVSPQAIAKARERLPDLAQRLIAAPLEQHGLLEDHFDAIALWDVVEHLWDPVSTLSKLLPLLRPGGAIVLSTPNIGSLSAKLQGRRWAFMTPPEHLVFFARNTMHQLFDRCQMTPLSWESKGKWTTAAFLLYKFNRVFPNILPGFALREPTQAQLNKMPVYVPTGDIQYACAVRP